MEGSVEEILRRLLLLGLPLIPTVGCGGSSPLIGSTSDAHFEVAHADPPVDADLDLALADTTVDAYVDALLADAAANADRDSIDVNAAEMPFIGPNCNRSADENLSIPRPDSDPDGGQGLTIAAWDACATAGDCTALCKAEATTGFPPRNVTTCERARGDGGLLDAGPFPGLGDANAPTVWVHLAYTYVDCTGRRPEGFRAPAPTRTGRAVGRWLADVATLEAASVPAFRRLARELRAHAAPGALVRAARESALDEVRHYRLTARAARLRGSVVRLSRARRLPVRDLLAVAAENAREGCVRETFGAVSAAYQAEHARDPELRALMTTIARDEARHAFLAWRIDHWARSVLPSASRARVDDARRAAAAELARGVETASPPPRLASAAGLPSGPVARALLEKTRALLWLA
jgi:hypothetical protein